MVTAGIVERNLHSQTTVGLEKRVLGKLTIATQSQGVALTTLEILFHHALNATEAKVTVEDFRKEVKTNYAPKRATMRESKTDGI